jgi:hypothetical protein
VTAHGAIGCSSHHRMPVAGGVGPCEQAGGHSASSSTGCLLLTTDARG